MVQTDKMEYVDLGLPSGLKWAKCNVGAEKETDYGYYFQWGDIVDKSNAECSWENYKYCDGVDDIFTKYHTSTSYSENPDNKTTLDLENDAARANMGGDWRMPTQADFRELIANTNREWIINYNGSGVSGRKFTSKINGNSIFIPASGFRSDSSFYDQGSSGLVWSSSLYAASPNLALILYFNSVCINASYILSRYYGLAVRGVMD